MLTSVIRFSLTQRLFVLIVALIIMLAGARAWFSIPLDAFPDISPTHVKIILKAPGMTPEEIEALQSDVDTRYRHVARLCEEHTCE